MKLMKYFNEKYVPARLTGRSAKTIKDYRCTIRKFSRWYKSKHGCKPTITDLDRETVQSYMAYCYKSGNAATTVNKACRAL